MTIDGSQTALNRTFAWYKVDMFGNSTLMSFHRHGYLGMDADCGVDIRNWNIGDKVVVVATLNGGDCTYGTVVYDTFTPVVMPKPGPLNARDM